MVRNKFRIIGNNSTTFVPLADWNFEPRLSGKYHSTDGRCRIAMYFFTVQRIDINKKLVEFLHYCKQSSRLALTTIVFRVMQF